MKRALSFTPKRMLHRNCLGPVRPGGNVAIDAPTNSSMRFKYDCAFLATFRSLMPIVLSDQPG